MAGSSMPDGLRCGRPTLRLLGRLAALLLLGFWTQAAATGTPTRPDSAAAGRRLFLGESSLQGAIAGHPEPLPVGAASCANCHQGDAGSGSGRSFAPRLDRLGLTEPAARRGGPPTAFSSGSFCRVLRTGVDPAYILITRQMPRYTISDDQCLGLWRYLMETGH